MDGIERQWTRPRRLIRCSKTKRYFAAEGWTEKAEKAVSFGTEIEALHATLRWGYRDVELIMREPESQVEVFSMFFR